jgi:hypothetical protein
MALKVQPVTLETPSKVVWLLIESVNHLIRASQLADFAAFKAGLALAGVEEAKVISLEPNIPAPPLTAYTTEA